MAETKKIKEEKSVEDRKQMIKDQLEKAVMEREKLMSLIYKCQGALELLDDMEDND
jgi:hypothetical protein